MFQASADWNPKQSLLKEIILNKERFAETVRLLGQMHALVHSREVYGTLPHTYMDDIWDGLDDHSFRKMPTAKDVTVAWNIWHITRIEDLTVNILIKNDAQVLDSGWLQRLGTRVKDTANAMTDDEIIRFSIDIDKESLYAYRNAVGVRTKQAIESLAFADLKTKVSAERLARIRAEGGVLDHEESIWLLDFWGRKTVAGIFLMPVARHQIVHLNDCVKLKAKCEKLR